MPSTSKRQQALMAIAEHEPSKVKPENKGVVKMTKTQLHEFASTDTKGLPVQVKKEKKHTTTIKHKDDGPVASKGQRKQMADLMRGARR